MRPFFLVFVLFLLRRSYVFPFTPLVFYCFFLLMPNEAEVFQLLNLGFRQRPVLDRILLLLALLVYPASQLRVS